MFRLGFANKNVIFLVVTGILGRGGRISTMPCRFFGVSITVGEKPTKKELVGMVKLNLL